MVFQIMDDKKECLGVYTNGQFIYDRIPAHLDRTWGYSDYLKDRHIQYAILWAEGASISDICPEHLKERWRSVEKKIKAHFKSIAAAKININDICFFDIVPNVCNVPIRSFMISISRCSFGLRHQINVFV